MEPGHGTEKGMEPVTAVSDRCCGALGGRSSESPTSRTRELGIYSAPSVHPSIHLFVQTGQEVVVKWEPVCCDLQPQPLLVALTFCHLCPALQMVKGKASGSHRSMSSDKYLGDIDEH
jgi:hypothetical protein